MNTAIDKFYGMTSADKEFDIVIIGLGKTGLSCARFFSSQNKSIAITDSRQDPPELKTVMDQFPDITLHLGCLDPGVMCKARQLIVSPGVSLKHPAIKTAQQAGVAISGDIEIFCQTAASPIVAVTGSNGKSTVATMIYRMIIASGRAAKLGGNIGTPALDLLAGKEPEFYVLELSSFQLEATSSLNAIAAVILNITEDHMDRYSSMEEYAHAKTRIFNGSGIMVVNLDDEIVSALPRDHRTSICFTARRSGKNIFGVLEIDGQLFISYDDKVVCPVADLPIHGRHNLSNTLAALALGSAIGLPMQGMLAGMRDFENLPHRSQQVAHINGVDWINDSKATNIGASCAAIEGLADNNNVILIAGGEGKGADFSPLAKCAQGRVKAAILLGKDAHRLAEVLKQTTAVYFAKDMEAAVGLAFRLSCAGDIVLLSPACSSLDMYEDYQHRGREFMHAVTRVCKP